ncbi:unnamed protein product [Trichobilharzia regenti]|nr:unnamed protein product [Trichobilharzia regenti]
MKSASDALISLSKSSNNLMNLSLFVYILVLNLSDMEFRHYTDGSFDSRYDIMEELAR